MTVHLIERFMEPPFAVDRTLPAADENAVRG
jgi:hypothetical protein